jgi:hypothetical protein
MKAVSVLHPAGSRIATGEKTIEVRPWRPDLAPDEDVVIVETHRRLEAVDDTDLNGRIVAVAKVKAVRPFTVSDIARACALFFQDGQLAWELTEVRPVRPPRGPVTAARKLYELDVTLEELLDSPPTPKARSA